MWRKQSSAEDGTDAMPGKANEPTGKDETKHRTRLTDLLDLLRAGILADSLEADYSRWKL